MKAPTPEQQAVIDAQDGTVLVLAAVGSGKTTTLSRRMARAVAQGAEPARVLALTFTNRAARHLREGLARQAGPEVAAVATVGTFHGLCARILREEAEHVGLVRDFRVVDEDDAVEIVRTLGVPKPADRWYELQAAMADEAHPSLARWEAGAFSHDRLARAYVAALGERGAVDFGGLVLLVRALMVDVTAARERWARRYDRVLVDEVQDTHPSEYDVLRVLASHARSFCLVGDLDQTIYGWRGSAPAVLLAALDQDFAPVQRLTLTANFRSTRAILALADRLAGEMPDRFTTVIPCDAAEPGEPPGARVYATAEAEARAVAHACAASVAQGRRPEAIAVLARTNAEVLALAQALEQNDLTAATVDQFRFVRRTEVKDALALAGLTWNRQDETAARRVARRLVQGVGPETLRPLLADGQACGLRLCDLLDPVAVQAGDPLWALAAEEIVVLDTETTGLDPSRDEVIEVAAVRADPRTGQAKGAGLQALVRNSVPVGASAAVHGITDARLAAEGRPAAEVLASLAAFVGERPVVGHNVQFDLDMLQGHGARAGVELRYPAALDTLLVARRLVDAPGYRLGDLVTLLGIAVTPTHRAMDDVLATVELVRHLAALAGPGQPQRWSLVTRFASRFARLRARLDHWRAGGHRPAELVARIVDEVLCRKLEPPADKRLANLRTLVTRVAELDDGRLPPARALREVVERATLVRDTDLLDRLPGVRVLTMHQAKGLEFEEVFVPGLYDGGVPSWLSRNDPDRLSEERRLLYVAVTRARERLHLSRPARNARGHPTEPSRFLPPGLLAR